MIFPLLSVLAGCDNITTVKIDVGKVRITDKGDDDLSRVTIKCNNGVVIEADWKRNSASISPAAGEATIEDLKLLVDGHHLPEARDLSTQKSHHLIELVHLT